ncbi:uncharacterized protein [Rhodnius prolixus]|uniref:Uncharacterized protein n=1 Tax=Rhodnius prolixus TaxID=13249 RepID=T1HXQ1_RHOPR
MGISTINEVTVNALKNWADAIERERKGAILWNEKWGWIVDEYRSSVDELIDLRSKREYVEPKKHVDERTVLPFPVTTASEVGWLSSRPEFQLEKFGPYPYTKGWTNPPKPDPEVYQSFWEKEN